MSGPSPEHSDIRLLDLAGQRRRLGSRIEDAMARVVEHGQFIMGPEVTELEEQLASYCGCAEAITCSSGTDALVLVLLARGVGPGQAVFVPSFTFAATAGAVAVLGATPVFVDITPGDLDMDPVSLEEAISAATASGLSPVGVIAVDLFGQPADYDALGEIARAHDLWMLADAAQSFGATLDGRRVGTCADATATSFFPTKPLGGYGDGGAIMTDDAELAQKLRFLRVHGLGPDGRSVHVGINGRLDTLQAAVLTEKLSVFPEELSARQRIAERYSIELKGVVELPAQRSGTTSAWAQYTVQVDDRDRVAADMRAEGVPTAVYYPEALHRHPAYRSCPVAPNGLPVSERASSRVLSLPLQPYLTEEEQTRVIAAVRRSVGTGTPAHDRSANGG